MHEMPIKTLNIAVIGGGPAGFIAAITAAEDSDNNINIDILEKHVPLKTILYTGNGRCNLSNELYDYKEFASNYPRGEKFLYSVFNRFGMTETIEWFNNNGIETYAQEDKRIFPQTNKAATVRNILLKKAERLSIKTHKDIIIEKIIKNDDKFTVYTDKTALNYDAVIIATGGKRSDSSKNGYKIAKSFGHSIKELKPSLSALITQENFIKQIAGVSVKNAEISCYFENKQIKKTVGDFIFTHKGVSGPAIYTISAYSCYLDYSKNNPLLLKINFVPDLSIQDLETTLLEELNSNPHKSLDNLLKKYLSKSLINILLQEANLDAEKKSSQITKEDRKKIIKILTETELHAIFPEPDGEIVTAGGVSLDEINPKTMESKLVKGLYFCGEVMDIDGLTGGFNLQACWSTGYIAGLSIALR